MRTGLYVRVSTDEQRDSGHSIDSQLRLLKEHCEKNNFDIVDVYNDAGHSGKDLLRPEMQRLLKDIKNHKIDKLLAIKVDRLTRNNYDGFWLLNYCEANDVKIELILEPYDVSTANGEMIFGMNLVFGQRERKEIGARTKRGLEEMALKKIHPNRAPYGYIRNKETGHLEVDPIESIVVKEIYDLCAKGHSIRGIASIMKENNRYLKVGKWKSDRVYNILINPIYIGKYAFGLYKRKPKDILYVEDYCEPVISKSIWKRSRATLEKNKHSNYGEHIHLFTSLVKCPECKGILSSTLSCKYNRDKSQKTDYYFLHCKNHNCKLKGLHYNCDKVEQKLYRVLNELTRYMLNADNEIITSNSTKSKELKDIDKALEKLKLQEKKLVDLYISSSLNVEAINQKNENIKKEIAKLTTKKESMFPDNDDKEYTTELLKKLNATVKDDEVIFYDYFNFNLTWETLNKKAKKELINRCIASLEISRDDAYEVYIDNIQFTDEFISKSFYEYLDYLKDLSKEYEYGIIYKEQIDKQKYDELSKDYLIISLEKFVNKEYTAKDLDRYSELMAENIYDEGIISCPYVDGETIIDNLILIPKES